MAPSFSITKSHFSPYTTESSYNNPINGKTYEKVVFVLSKYEEDTIMIKYPNSIVKISVGDVYELLNIK